MDYLNLVQKDAKSFFVVVSDLTLDKTGSKIEAWSITIAKSML